MVGQLQRTHRRKRLYPRRAPLKVRPDPLGPALDAFVPGTKRYGDLPTMDDWDPARARRLGQDSRIARYLQGEWPSALSSQTFRIVRERRRDDGPDTKRGGHSVRRPPVAVHAALIDVAGSGLNWADAVNT